jgi:hypothetical protein
VIGMRVVNKPLTIYGKGNLGKLAAEVMGKLNIPVKLWVDKEDQIAVNKKDKYLLAVCVASEPYRPIHKGLTEAGWTDVASIYDIFNAYPEGGIGNGWVEDEEPTAETRNSIANVHYAFESGWSCNHYEMFVAWRAERIELPVMRWAPISPRDTLPSTLADIKARRRRVVFKDEPMDVAVFHSEGWELENVRQNMPVLQKHRPCVEVACYHSRDGLWMIEKELMEGLPDYAWSFRVHAYQGQGAYIYGTPKERV